MIILTIICFIITYLFMWLYKTKLYEYKTCEPEDKITLPIWVYLLVFILGMIPIVNLILVIVIIVMTVIGLLGSDFYLKPTKLSNWLKKRI